MAVERAGMGVVVVDLVVVVEVSRVAATNDFQVVSQLSPESGHCQPPLAPLPGTPALYIGGLAVEEVEGKEPVQLPSLAAVTHQPDDVLVPRISVLVCD